MRGFGMRSALVAASVVWLVAGGCTAPAARSTARAPVAARAPAGAASPGGTGYTADGMFFAVAATSATNAWAVGGLGVPPLIVHWNGSTWSRVPTGAPAGTVLDAVAASSPDNAWALGGDFRAGSTRQGPVI